MQDYLKRITFREFTQKCNLIAVVDSDGSTFRTAKVFLLNAVHKYPILFPDGSQMSRIVGWQLASWLGCKI